jgi:putative tryptophan/tyrosine transport system substrate-binding protein
MKRRKFIAGLGGAVAWPALARAQQGDRVRRLGVLVGLAEEDPETQGRLAAFRQGMLQRGWTEGRNLQIDYRWAGPEAERLTFYAGELVRAQPDLILAITSPSVAALQRATHTIPIVFAGIGDPVGQGFVVSLARPGGNITGFTGLEFTLGEKWVSFLKELAPGVTRIAYLFHPEIGPYYALWLKSVEAAAATLGLETTAAPVRAPSDIEHAITAIAVHPDGGLIVQPDGYTVTNRRLIIELAARHRLPAVYTYRYEAVEGGLVSYGADVPDQFRRAADYVDRILKGQTPSDLPVQQPLKYELVINLKTAEALGLTIPTNLLVRVDEVIE